MANQLTPGNPDSLPLSPEEIKAIGEIELGPSRHEKFLNAHYKKLIVVVVVIMLIAVSCIIYGTWRANQESDGAAAVISAMKTTTAGTAADAAGYDAALLEQVQANYSGTAAAATAELLRGMQLVAAGQEQQGTAVLESFIATTADAALRVRAQAYLAARCMSAGDAKKATELWQAVTGAGMSPYLPIAYLSLGDLAQESGETEQARAFYTKLQEECPSSPVLRTVQQRLLLLGVDAPEPVAPAPAAPAAPAAKDTELPSWNSPL